MKLFVGALAFLVSAAANAQVDRDFTRVPALEPNVAFWKKVYIEWGTNDITYADDEDLAIIYRTIRVPPRGGATASGVTRAEVVKRGQADTVAALARLAAKNPKSSAGLVGVELEIYENLKGVTRADKYNRASHMRVQNGLRERFLQGWANSGLYAEFIKQELRDNGLPDELIGVAFVESLFQLGAKSKVGAAGVWQFMSYTGKEYMFLNDVVDERWDPILATEAACKYLKQAKKELGTWPLAITSYNYGRGGVKGLVNGAGTKDFGVILAVSKNKRFGFQARNYYASFLAIHDIITNPDKYMKGVARKSPWSYDVIRVPFPVFTTQIAATGVVDLATLDGLNPAFTTEAEEGRVPLSHGQSIRVPRGKGAAVVAALQALPEGERTRALKATKAVHTCTGKQTLAEIAKKYSIGVDQLAIATGLTSTDVPRKGERLPIPVATARYTLLPEARGMPVPPAPAPVRILLADASPVRDSADDDDAKAAKLAKAEADKIAKAEKLAKAEADKIARAAKHEPAALTSTVQGIVTAGRITITELEDSMPAVDIIAGTDTASLPEVDVIAGDPGEDAPWPLAESQPHEAAPTS